MAHNANNDAIYFIASQKGANGYEQSLTGKIDNSGKESWQRAISNNTADVLPSDIEVNNNSTHVITVLDASANDYQTTGFNELEKDTASVHENNDTYRIKHVLLVDFQKRAIIPAKINNTDLVHGIIADFVDSTYLAELVELTGNGEIPYYKCYKVHPTFIMADTISTSRSGRTVDMFPHYTTFGIMLPQNSNDSVMAQSFISAPNVITYAGYNHLLRLHAGANDTEYANGSSAGLKSNTLIPNASINVEPAWDITTGKPEIRVGVFDSGINFTHYDLGDGTFAGSRIKGGLNYYNGQGLSNINSNDASGHGTAVADKIGAFRNNNYGIAGIAGGDYGNSTGISLYDMKIVVEGPTCNQPTQFASEDNISRAIIAGAIDASSGGFAQHIQNHSWGGGPYFTKILRSFIDAYKNEVIMTVSSGNAAYNNSPCLVYEIPATYHDNMVMKVGANDITGKRASFSECGHDLDFIAPGTNDLYNSLSRTGSTITDKLEWAGSSTCTFQATGTSFAAPHAAGTAALYLSYATSPFMPNGLYPEDVEQLMQHSATDLTVSPNAPGYDPETGYGRINAGQGLMDLYYPGHLVLHKTFTMSASSAALMTPANGPCEHTCLWEGLFNLPQWTKAPVKRYRLVAFPTHTIPAGYTFVNGWERGVASNLLDGDETLVTGGSVLLGQSCGMAVNSKQTKFLPNVTKYNTSYINSTGAMFEGFTYEILHPTTFATLGWYPISLSETAVFPYTLYLKSNSLGIEEDKFTENSFYMYPNPSMDKIYFKSRLKEFEKIDVEIVSALGQSVFRQNNLSISEQNSVDVSQLANGIYFVKLTNNKKTIVEKLIVSK